MTLLSNKSREKLNDLRDFNFTQRYFTIDAKCHRSKARSERETVYWVNKDIEIKFYISFCLFILPNLIVLFLFV